MFIAIAMRIFIICGYGLVKDVGADENYRTYLHSVFNQIYSLCANEPATIIPCGGPTVGDGIFEGTEAVMVGSYLQAMMDRATTKQQTRDWNVVLEDRSLSSLENLVFAKQLIDTRHLSGPITIFCEATRVHRNEKTAEIVFGGETRIAGIDFDVSQNRYLDPAIIHNKESTALAEALWTLENPERLARHHKFFEQKLAFFRERQAAGIRHVDVCTEWMTKGPALMKELMPEHPMFRKVTTEIAPK
jgi:hypothetical protein